MTIILTTIIIAFVAYLCVDACERTKDPKKWDDFLDDAGVKRK